MNSVPPGTPKIQNTQSRPSFIQGSNLMSSIIPAHFTPPSGISKFMAQNPFEADLINRLHSTVISPSVFSKTKSKSSADVESPNFSWTIDELARCKPVKIDEMSVQESYYTSPETERVAQSAILKFFYENQIAPSPVDSKPINKDISRKLNLCMSSKVVSAINSTSEVKTTRDCWTQTVITFPSKLPEEVEEALKPFCTFTQEQNTENEEINTSSNSSLRRKLFDFNNSDCTSDDDQELSLSPIKGESLKYCHSPPERGMLMTCTPLKNSINGIDCNNESPISKLQSPLIGNISPIAMTPIINGNTISEPMSCQSINISRKKSVMKLDFTANMSIESSFTEENKENCPTAMTPVRNKRLLQYSNFIQNCDNDVEMMVEENTPVSEIKKFRRISNDEDPCEIYSSTFRQNHTTFSQPANNLQDTGYQTCSISVSNNTGKYSSMGIKKQMTWKEENMPNSEQVRQNGSLIFSSTPSKNHYM